MNSITADTEEKQLRKSETEESNREGAFPSQRSRSNKNNQTGHNSHAKTVRHVVSEK